MCMRLWSARCRVIACLVVLALVDQLFLQALLDTPTCAEVYSASTAPSGTNNSSSITDGNSAGLGASDPVSSAFLSFGVAFDSDRASIARYVCVPTLALANSRYQGAYLLPAASLCMWFYTGLTAADELSACAGLTNIAWRLQREADAASQAAIVANATLNNSSSIEAATLLPLSATATALSLIVFQRVALWTAAALAALLVTGLTLRRVRGGHLLSCAKPGRHERSVRLAQLQLFAGAEHTHAHYHTHTAPERVRNPMAPGPAPAQAHHSMLHACLHPLARVWRSASRYASVLPLRVCMGLLLGAFVTWTLSITLLSTAAGLAVWAHRLLSSSATLRDLATEIVDSVTGTANDGGTTQLVDLVVTITTITLEAVYALLVSLCLGLSAGLVVTTAGLVVSARRFHDAHFEIMHAAAAQAEAPPTPTPTPAASTAPQTCGQRVRSTLASVWSGIVSFLSWSQPGGLKGDGSLDLSQFSYYSAMSYIPFVVVNTVLAFIVVYVLVAAVAFLFLFRPLRTALLGWVLTPAMAITIVDWGFRNFVFQRILSDTTRIHHPRCFMFFDFMYSFTIGVISGLIMAVTRVLQGAVWSAWRCMLLDEPLLPGPLAWLDSGWCMYGAVMKCKYANGTPPRHHLDGKSEHDAHAAHGAATHTSPLAALASASTATAPVAAPSLPHHVLTAADSASTAAASATSSSAGTESLVA